MPEQYANFATTTLNGAINNSVTSVVVTNGAVFPSTGTFRIVIDVEIMICTSRSGNTLTVTRAAESTSAMSHSDGADVKSPLTRASFKKVIEDSILQGTAVNRPTAGEIGRLYLPSDAHIFARDSGLLWLPFGPIRQMKNPNDYSSWSYGRNQAGNGLSWTVQEFSQTLRYNTVATSGIGFEAIRRAAPTAPFKITACILSHNTNAQFKQYGIGFRNNTDDKVSYIRVTWDNNSIYRTIASGWDQSGGSSNSQYANLLHTNPTWFQIEDDNTNHYFRFSVDGINWNLIQQESRTTHFSGSSSHVWWGGQLFGNTGELAGITLISWLEE